MQSSNFNGNQNLSASCLVALCAIWAMACPGGAMAWTGQPLAYVTSPDGILVIDTGDDKVVDTIPGPALPTAVAPDGKHLYAFGSASDLVANISVIDTTDDKVVATIPLDVSIVVGGVSLDQNSSGIAVAPNGKDVYVTTGLCPFPAFACHPESVYFVLWEIDTATNKVVAASVGKGIADGIAFTPDGKHTYFANFDPYTAIPQVLVDLDTSIALPANGSDFAIAITPNGRRAYVPCILFNGVVSENVVIIDTETNTVGKTLLLGTNDSAVGFTGVVVTPDGRYVYVTNAASNNVAVIGTTTNTIVSTVASGMAPAGIEATPDGKRIYVANQGSNNVAVIDTISNKVVTVIPVTGPSAISIIPPPQGVPFLSLSATLDIDLRRKPIRDSFDLGCSFILNSRVGGGFHPETEPVKLQVGAFIATIPAGSFRRREERSYTFEGVVDGVRLKAKIELMGNLRYAFRVEAKGANLSGTTNPVQVSLGVGDNAGLTWVKAHFDRDHHADNDWEDHWH